jgi:hypothetical protein
MAKRNSLADNLERRVRRAIFWNALLRWESATVIALTLVISAFLGLLALASNSVSMALPLVSLGVGTLIEAILFTSSITDEKENARVVAALLRDQYKARNLRSPKLKTQLNKALEYQGLITTIVQRSRAGVLHDRLDRATEPVADWIDAIYRLATRLDGYEQNRVIKRDLRSVPGEITKFEQRLAAENDPAVQDTLRRTIADKERQLEHLNHLQNTMEKAEYQMESTLAALGTVYAQLQAINVRGAEKGRAERLREEIDEQVDQLQDLSQAMDEVYAAR